MSGKYAEAGVDIGKEGRAVRSLVDGLGEEISQGVFAKFLYKDGIVIGTSTDGVGSKLISYVMIGDVTNSAYDLLAMNVTDLAADYIQPLIFTNCLAVHKPDERLSKQIGMGLRKACAAADVISGGGESATLPDQIKKGTFDWTGSAMGIGDAEKHKMWIERRNELREGLYLVGVESSGLHSNGATLARKMVEAVGPDVPVPDSEKTVIQELTTPTYIYSPLMVGLRDDVHAFVPITGGGVTNICRVLPKNLDARMENREVHPFFRFMQDALEVEEKEMYRVFNMGTGLVMVVQEPGKVIDQCTDAGYSAKNIGELVPGTGAVHMNEHTYEGY